MRGRAVWFWWAAPVFLLLALYWEGLHCWFIADDFAWLGLIRQVHSFRGLISILFEPSIHGTIRPLSERGFFLLLESIFGLDPLPFHIMTFATMAADLWLIGWIMRRITGSPAAALVAQICWLANAALATVMAWAAAYNEALCPFFLLLALALFLRFAETGRRSFWWWQLVVFSLGFGALELNVVYPAIAAGFVVLVAPPEKRRHLLLSLVPLAAISLVYFAVNRAIAPVQADGPYTMHVDRRIFSTLLVYLKWSILPMSWNALGHSHRAGRILVSAQLAGLIALAAAEIRARRSTLLFFVVWFLATLGPMLLLPDHHEDYLLTIPAIGVGMLAGYSFWRWRLGSILPIAAYLAAAVPIAHAATHWWLLKALPVRAVVLGVESAHRTHPDKTILLDGISRQLYEDSIGQAALFPLGIENVYLTPESRDAVPVGPGLADPDDTVLNPAVALHALENDRVVVYSLSGDHLRNVTERYERSAPSRLGDRLPSRVDIGNPLYSWLLGPEWLIPEDGVRWMPGQASLRLDVPDSGGRELRIEGYCPEELLKQAPRHLSIQMDGVSLGDAEITDPEANFVRLFKLPEPVAPGKTLGLTIRVTPVVRKDGREYGLLFGKFAIVR